MIKNVIFDYGQVLVRFEPLYMVNKYVKNEGDAKLLSEAVFDRLYWDALDSGTMEDEEALALIKERVPRSLHSKVDEIYWNWIYNLPDIEGMEELILRLKTQHGVGLYLLSNISRYFSRHAHEKRVISHFDGVVFSADCALVKPSREIFEHLCRTYSLVPEECIFIDDNKKNTDGALAFGINAYLFDGDAGKLSKFLDNIL